MVKSLPVRILISITSEVIFRKKKEKKKTLQSGSVDFFLIVIIGNSSLDNIDCEQRHVLQVLELSLWAKSPAQVCLFELSKICYLSNHSWRYRHNLHNIISRLLYLLSIGFRFNTSESFSKPSTHSYKILMQNSLSISLII